MDHRDVAGSRDTRDRNQRAVAHDGQHDVEQLFGDIGGAGTRPECGADLRARLRSGRQFEVPTRIGPAGPPPQRDPPGGQVVLRGVEVHGLQGLRR